MSIPPALPSFCLFILLLLAGDINPNPGPLRCPKVTYANIRSIHNKYPVNLFLIMTLISSPGQRLGLDLTPRVQICPKSAHQATISVTSHERFVEVEDWAFSSKMDWLLPLFQQRPAPPLKISSSRYPFTKNPFTFSICIDQRPPVPHHFLNSFSHFWRIFIIPQKIW